MIAINLARNISVYRNVKKLTYIDRGQTGVGLRVVALAVHFEAASAVVISTRAERITAFRLNNCWNHVGSRTSDWASDNRENTGARPATTIHLEFKSGRHSENVAAPNCQGQSGQISVTGHSTLSIDFLWNTGVDVRFVR